MKLLYHSLSILSASIDKLIAGIGKIAAWLSFSLVIVTCVVVMLRYGFGIGAIALQELAIYMFATLFMLGIAYTFARDGHVRVDVFYRHLDSHQKAWINIVGGLFFLLPSAFFLVLLSWDFAAQAWVNFEASIEADGLPFVYLLKSLIPVCGALLFLQGLSNIIDNTLLLVGYTHTRADQVATDEVMV